MEANELIAGDFVKLEALGRTIYFARSDSVKEELVRTQALSPSQIYTMKELEILVAYNRTQPFTKAELETLDRLKRIFGATISG